GQRRNQRHLRTAAPALITDMVVTIRRSLPECARPAAIAAVFSNIGVSMNSGGRFVNKLHTSYFAAIDFSQITFEMTTLCHSEVPISIGKESVILHT
ncbi:MAG: hypothetical protein KDH97_13140, partial [Calditrichaeota bacterium]|nr:hypothetical protein [Calditrichota bacterium]